VAPEQAGALPQSGGFLVAALVARRKAAGAFPYRAHSQRNVDAILAPFVVGKVGVVALAHWFPDVRPQCSRAGGSVRSGDSLTLPDRPETFRLALGCPALRVASPPAAITAKWVSGLRGGPS
jgi:hypothetical protein